MSGGSVLLAPENPAGVASALRDALRRRGRHADLVVIRPHPFALPHDRLATTYAARFREGLLAPLRYRILHFHFGTTLCEFADAVLARAAGRLVLMHYWGSDVRTRSGVERRGSVRARTWDASERSERTIARRLRLAGRSCHAALVSDLELLAYVDPWFDRVYVVPTPLAPPVPGPPPPDLDGEGPIVFHAPSKPSGKGTAEIVAALERVARRRPLRPRMVAGVPHARVLAEIARADIVVDQLHSETSGVFALEAMALGKPVLLEFRREALAPFARQTPLVGVSADTIEREVERLCDDAARRAALGEAGRRFIAEVHDADRVAAAIEHVYAHAVHAPPGRYEATVAGIRPLASASA